MSVAHTSSHPTSNTLLSRVRQNDPAAWEHLIQLYAPVVYRACLRSRLPAEDIADIFQDVFHAAVTKITAFEKRNTADSFRGWLFTITRNKINDHFRRQKKEPRGIGGTELQRRMGELEAPAELASRDGAPAPLSPELAEHDLLREALHAIRGSFREPTWRAFQLTAIEERPTADVAEELHMSPGAVRVAKSRVLQRLRAELGDLY